MNIITKVCVWAALIFFDSNLQASENLSVAIIGTGDMGGSLGPKLAEAGYQIIYGSRDPSRDSVRELVAKTGGHASAATQKIAAQEADIVLLAVPWPPMEHVAQNLGNLDGKIIIDISTPFRQAADGYMEITIETSSPAGTLRAPLPRACDNCFTLACTPEALENVPSILF